MTEDEAKTKWCPPSWGHSTPSRCVGANCMAWRWHARIPDVIRALREETGVGMVEAHKIALDMFEGQPGAGGYCGLAGTPPA